MKKLLAALMALMLVFGCLSALAEDKLIYEADFTKPGMDGWAANNATGKVTKDGAFLITGRTQDWNAPKRDFKLDAGVKYKVSVEVYQDAADSISFSLTGEYNGGGWVHLAEIAVPKGEWTLLEVTFTLEEKKGSLYVETIEAPKADYQIRNFKLYEVGEEEAAEEAPAPKWTFSFAGSTEAPAEEEAVEEAAEEVVEEAAEEVGEEAAEEVAEEAAEEAAEEPAVQWTFSTWER